VRVDYGRTLEGMTTPSGRRVAIDDEATRANRCSRRETASEEARRRGAATRRDREARWPRRRGGRAREGRSSSIVRRKTERSTVDTRGQQRETTIQGALSRGVDAFGSRGSSQISLGQVAGGEGVESSAGGAEAGRGGDGRDGDCREKKEAATSMWTKKTSVKTQVRIRGEEIEGLWSGRAESRMGREEDGMGKSDKRSKARVSFASH
jgi:hypothetical protein